MAEVFRVLKPDGQLHMADWGRPANLFIRAAFLLFQLLDCFDTTSDNVRGYIAEALTRAGFVDVRETRRYATVFGTQSLYTGRKPA